MGFRASLPREGRPKAFEAPKTALFAEDKGWNRAEALALESRKRHVVLRMTLSLTQRVLERRP